MPHRFVIKDRGQLHSFSAFDDIPPVFDHLIEFAPEVPPPPHTHAQHREIDQWNDLLKDLMGRERASSS